MRVLDAPKALFQYLPVLLGLFVFRPLHFIAYHWNRAFYHKTISRAAKWALFYWRIKLLVKTSDPIPKSGEYLIVANHQSFLDIPIILSLFPAAFVQRFVSYIPGISWHFGKLSLIIERENPISLIRAIKYVKKTALEQRIPVAMFPEATRSIDGTLSDLRLGAAMIAKNLNLPLLPVVIYNSRELMPRGSIVIRGGKVLVAVQSVIGEEYVRGHSAEEINKEIKIRLNEGLAFLSHQK